MSCEGSRLQNGGLTILLVSLTADSTTLPTTNIALFPVISSEHSESRNLFRHYPARPWNLFPLRLPPRWCPGNSVPSCPAMAGHFRHSGPSQRFLRHAPRRLRSLGHNLSPSGPSPYTRPGVDTPPDTTSPSGCEGKGIMC